MQREMLSVFARSLNRIIQEGRFTVCEMAEVAQCSERHLYNVRNGEADLSVSKAERLSRWLCEHGELRPARGMICPAYVIQRRADAEVNGCVEDEMNDLVRFAGAVSEAHRARDVETMDKNLLELDRVMDRLKAERGLLT